MKITEYANGTIVKYDNKRILVAPFPNDEFVIQTKILDGNLSERSTHEVVGGKIVVTTLKLSLEGAIALYSALQNELKRAEKEGLI